MARILGVDIPNGKKIKVSLTYIYGIGDSRALEICSKAKVDPEKRTSDLDQNELAAIREVTYVVMLLWILKDFKKSIVIKAFAIVKAYL